MKLKTIQEAKISGKRVLVRCGFDVPFSPEGRIIDDERIKECLETIKFLLAAQAKIILCGHNGRPKGKVVPQLSMTEVALRLEALLGRPVKKLDESIGPEVEHTVAAMHEGDIIVLENLRFHAAEEENDREFARQLSTLADAYVNEAFANSHREHASMVGVPEFLPACAGFRLQKEITTLSQVIEAPSRPLVAIIGGAKISDKINVITAFLKLADHVLIGGALANTILKAKGVSVGRSLVEEKMMTLASQLALTDNRFHLPVDVITAGAIDAATETSIRAVGGVSDDEYILDIGPDTVKLYGMIIEKAQTIVWGGPMGYFELEPFSHGTQEIARLIADSPATSITGGGDTLEAINRFGYKEKITFTSTGGGAMLEFLEGKILPGIKPLMQK